MSCTVLTDVASWWAGRALRPAHFLLSVCLVAVLGGCGQPLRSLPPAGLTAHHQVVVFNDGSHSGLLLPWPDPDLVFLDPRNDDPPSRMPWLEIGFGADAWTRLGGGSSVAARLAFGSSAAVLMLRHQPGMFPMPRPGVEPQLWKVDLDQAAWERLKAHLAAAVDRELSYPRKPGATDWVVFAVERWSIVHNCHDWTAGCLVVCGLDIDHPIGRTSSGFQEEITAISRQLAEAGITVIGPGPAADHSNR
jgi:hypothetical protein